MSTYNPLNQGGANLDAGTVENKGLFNRLLRNLSSFGMKYDDMVIRNTVGIGMNEDPLSQKNNSMYDFFSQRAVAQVLNKKFFLKILKNKQSKKMKFYIVLLIFLEWLCI
mgnify:CR=1 FL=1